MKKDFLLEIGTEEIPAGAMPKILKQVEELAASYLKIERLPYTAIEVMGTPRRIALIISALEEKAEDLKEKHKGPSVKIAFDAEHKPTKAAEGFARGKGLAVVDLLEKDGYIYAETLTPGKSTKEIVTGLIPYVVNNLSFPKSMHWGNYDDKFIRPVRWFVTLLDQEVVPFEMASAQASNVTRGHRFLGKKEITIENPSSYVKVLRDNFIIVNPKERRDMIVSQLEAVAAEKNGTILWDEDLLEEVVYLVEYPTALCGTFDKKYLELPSAAVITPMKDHQRYFPMVDTDGMLMPMFLTVRNGNEEFIDIVAAGNERVLRARLEDARFFFNEDRKQALVERLEDLKKIVFQEGLGNMRDKTDRLIELSTFIGDICDVDQDIIFTVERAALLAKADLPTGMVTEFTELQGVMGKEYALLDGEDTEVSEAIFEQYLPRFAGDVLPTTKAGKILSIADKIDNIVATFSRGLIPTGSQDPYALRRQTIGVLNILIDSQWPIYLGDMFVKSAELLGVEEAKLEELLTNLLNFFSLRLKNIYLDRQWPHAVIDLLLSRKESTVASNEGMGLALIENPIYENDELIQAFTRVHNLVKHISYIAVDEKLFVEEEERKLYRDAKQAYATSASNFDALDYAGVLTVPNMLVQSINEFFEKVMVMDKDENIKNNRLQLLRLVYESFAFIGDISVLK